MRSDNVITRRRFIERSIAAGTAAASGCLTSSLRAESPAVLTTESEQLPIIDTHQHLWDLNRFRLPWLSGSPTLNRSFVTADYLQATRGLNVVKAVYMEVALDPAQQQAEAEYVIELCRSDRHPTVAAVISGQPASAGFDAYITAYRDSPYIKGVRRILHSGATPAGYCLQPQFVRSMQRLGELNMRFDLCVRAAELGDAVKLVDRCPDTRFVLDHCGNADPKDFASAAGSEAAAQRSNQWRRDIAALAKRKNVVCKISGIIARVPEEWTADDLAPIVNHCLDQFGPDRVMFASDWPVCQRRASLAQWVTALKQIVAQRSSQQQRKLFHDNALRFYELG
jgi:predicted TIM-barrel fold metal-dependent hydrolase